MSTADRERAVRAERLVVPDVLRGIALGAMLIAHARPFVLALPGGANFVIMNINDVASPLFALVMGMSAQILARRTPPDRRGALILQQSIRAIALIALGVWLSGWGSWVAIVLSQLGVLLLVGAPILFLSTRWVAGIAVAVALVGDPINAWARDTLRPILIPGTPQAEIASWLVLGGSYRVTNLLPFFLLGALLLRHGFRRDRVLWTMVIIAPVAYIVRPVAAKLLDIPIVSGGYPDTLHDVGLVFVVYVVVVFLATVRAPGPARVVAAVFVPFRAIGAVALSLYALHVALLGFWLQIGFVPGGNDFVRAALMIGISVAAGWLWWRFIGVGPIEWLLGWVTGRPKRWGSSRAVASVPPSDAVPAPISGAPTLADSLLGLPPTAQERSDSTREQ